MLLGIERNGRTTEICKLVDESGLAREDRHAYVYN